MRHLRLTQLLRYEGFTGKDLKLEREKEHKVWKEDGESLPTIEQTRKMHTTLGTWDKNTEWRSWGVGFLKGKFNRIILPNGQFVFPKANYEAIKKAKESRWEEQERRIKEFFDSMGV